MKILILNYMYSLVGVIFGLFSMYLGYKLLDRLITVDTSKLIEEGNIAMGVAVAGMFIGIGIMVSQVIGKALY